MINSSGSKIGIKYYNNVINIDYYKGYISLRGYDDINQLISTSAVTEALDYCGIVDSHVCAAAARRATAVHTLYR